MERKFIVMEALTTSIVEALSSHGVSPQIITFLISMIPLLELRGSIIVAGGLLKLPFIQTFIAAVLGNMLPIPFILLFIKKIFAWMRKSKRLRKFPEWCEKRAMNHSEQIEKYGYFGLFLFVAIPLPGTGAWTGSLIASLLEMKTSKCLIAVLCGVITAGLIMSVLSFGLIQKLI